MHHQKNHTIIFNRGIFNTLLTETEAIFMITGTIIGAGVLGLPYAVSKVGLLVGILYIVMCGAGMLFLNLVIGKISFWAQKELQLPGLVAHFLGKKHAAIVSLIIIFSAYGALTAYIIGEGVVLSGIFGGSAFLWSIFFWLVASAIIVSGFSLTRKLIIIVNGCVIFLLVIMSFVLLPHLQVTHIFYFNAENIFYPFGVVIFSLNGLSAIAQAHALLPKNKKIFNRVLVIGSLIPLLVYVVFVVAIVGYAGKATPSIATNIFANESFKKYLFFGSVLGCAAMLGGFMAVGTALKQSFMWDNKIRPRKALCLVLIFPLFLFLIGLRSFVFVISFVGTFGVGLEVFYMLWIYKKVRKTTPRF
jgi:amino acid permease